VLNGAEGLSEIAAGLVGQGLTILDSIKKNLATGPEATAGVVRLPDGPQDGQVRG
jgi:flotillin